MFYKQKLHQMEQSVGSADVHADEVGLSKAVYESWCDLTDDQRQTMITLAITESASRHSDDSRLSDDLMAVDIQPMCKLGEWRCSIAIFPGVKMYLGDIPVNPQVSHHLLR